MKTLQEIRDTIEQYYIREFGKYPIPEEKKEDPEEKEELAKARIYEPDGGTYSSTPSTPGAA